METTSFVFRLPTTLGFCVALIAIISFLSNSLMPLSKKEKTCFYLGFFLVTLVYIGISFETRVLTEFEVTRKIQQNYQQSHVYSLQITTPDNQEVILKNLSISQVENIRQSNTAELRKNIFCTLEPNFYTVTEF